MDFSRVKTFLLIFLLLVNLLIGSVFFLRLYSGYQAEQSAEAAVLEALQNLGTGADESLFSGGISAPAPLEIIRDPMFEAAVTGALLGEASMEDQGGGIYYYAGTRGYARFRSAGRFEIGLAKPYPVTASGEDAAREILDLTGISSENMRFSESPTAYGFQVTVTQSANGFPVFDRSFSLSFDENGLFEMSGTLLFGELRPIETVSVKSVEAALLRFADEMQKRGEDISELRSVSAGYQPAVPAPGVTRLTPVYAVVTDKGIFFVDAVTCTLYLPVA